MNLFLSSNANRVGITVILLVVNPYITNFKVDDFVEAYSVEEVQRLNSLIDCVWMLYKTRDVFDIPLCCEISKLTFDCAALVKIPVFGVQHVSKWQVFAILTTSEYWLYKLNWRSKSIQNRDKINLNIRNHE